MKQHEISAMLKAEERHTSNLEPHEIGFAPLDFSAGWRACAEWRDSQVEEPVAWVLMDDNSAPTRRTVFYADEKQEAIQYNESCYELTPVYPAPPTAQINQQLVEALEKFASLIQYQYTGSKQAMSALQDADNAAQAALAAAKGVKNDN